MKYIINIMSCIQKVFVLISLFQTYIATAQSANQWEISADPDMPYLTIVKPNEIGSREVPFLSTVQKIWDESLSGLPYNAFTDLIRFQGNWYCTFREGESHTTGTGRIRVIKSSDGKVWKSVAILELDGCDLRDPKFSITSEGELMINSLILFISYEIRPYKCQSVTWLSSDGETWSNVYACNSGINTWRWSVTWHNGIGYSIGYWEKDLNGTLYTTSDGKTWNVLAKNIFPMGKGNEASIDFDQNGRAYCLLRDGPGGMAHLGIAKQPYNEWKWTDLGMYAGGPEIIRLKDNRILAVVRLHEGGLPPSADMPGLSSALGGGRTSLCWINPEKGVMKEFLTLPSGGHGGHSYAGIVEYEGMVWISYYSSHENITKEQRPSIYLARVKLEAKKNSPQ
jgi:hypothetical protein